MCNVLNRLVVARSPRMPHQPKSTSACDLACDSDQRPGERLIIGDDIAMPSHTGIHNVVASRLAEFTNPMLVSDGFIGQIFQ
jgi:hypothetical protein